MTNITCPNDGNVPPEVISAVPNNVTAAITIGTNVSEPVLVGCCSPEPVHKIGDCWLWCELGSKYDSDQYKALNEISHCAYSRKGPYDSFTLHLRTSASQSQRVSITQLLVSVLVVGWCLHF